MCRFFASARSCIMLLSFLAILTVATSAQATTTYLLTATAVTPAPAGEPWDSQGVIYGGTVGNWSMTYSPFLFNGVVVPGVWRADMDTFTGFSWTYPAAYLLSIGTGPTNTHWTPYAFAQHGEAIDPTPNASPLIVTPGGGTSWEFYQQVAFFPSAQTPYAWGFSSLLEVGTSTQDLWFPGSYWTYTFTPQVPLPPAALLLGTGLIALAGWGRKLRKG